METSALKTDAAAALDFLKSHMLADGYDLVCDLHKSKGSRLYDAKRDTFFLDFFSCFATCPLGFNHPRLTTPEALKRLGEAAVNKPSNSDVYSWEMVEFMRTFTRVAKPDHMKYAFFIEGGALGVENCLKAAFDWKVQKNFAKGYKEEKGYKVIHFKDAFHGRTGYTLSLTNTDPNKTKYFPKFDWPRIDNPYCRFPLQGDNLEQVVESEKQALGHIAEIIKEEGDDVACIVLEPIQSEGGDHHFRPEFHQALRAICDNNDILMIYDEVQTGFGASGKFWAYEHYVRPDMLAFGKKAQVCGVLASARIDEVPDNVFRVSSRINSTWGGNLVDMVRCGMYLQIYEEENILQHVSEMGQRLLERLHDLQEEFPDKISNVRGKGLLCAFDMVDSATRKAFLRRLFEERLLMLPCGRRSVRFRTPLNISWDDLQEGLGIIHKVVSAM
ncbi:MAG TPA: L-lysine 6-transaminase [Acidobacteriota bacterium]|nr:L-lysine 6-transaminase [Acidobacteriota bacterium]